MGGTSHSPMMPCVTAARRRRSVRHRWVPVGVAAVCTAIAVPAIVAYACVGLVALEATPASVQPGGSVTLRGMDFVPSAPVQIHVDRINGPVIGTVTPAQMTGGVMSSRFNQTVTLPANLTTGQHVLVATQSAHNMNGGNPARTVLYVGVPAPAPAGPDARPAAAQLDSGPGWGVLVLIGLAAAVVGLLVFGFFLLRGPRAPSAHAGAA